VEQPRDRLAKIYPARTGGVKFPAQRVRAAPLGRPSAGKVGVAFWIPGDLESWRGGGPGRSARTPGFQISRRPLSMQTGPW